ncbi:MAG: ABC transporter substrate-binding protein [Thermomicrobiales bacterium]|nr:ABC transporter substrate-binding protein [Thermomicrobiales bacterium]
MRARNKSQAEQVTAEAKVSATETRDLAEAIIQTRKAAGMTQQQLAIAMGITQSTVADLERGRSLPSTRTLHKLAAATHHALHIRFVRQSQPNVSRIASHTMTDTLNRPGLSTDRRHFLGGAMGLAGLLGLGHVRHITAQEATAAAEKSGDFVWIEPEWGEERSLFTVIDRGNEVTLVETMDGLIEVPSDPRRIVALDNEQIAMFELGVAQNIIGIGDTSFDAKLPNSGDLTNDMHALLGEVPSVGPAWELDVEQVLLLDPDLILGNSMYQPDQQYELLSGVSSFIRKPLRTIDVPRSAVRDLGALFGVKEAADQILADHNAYMARAREALGTAFADKRILIGVDWPDSNEIFAITPYYIVNDSLSVDFQGYPTYRELGLSPTSFIETLSAENRETFYLTFSIEDLGKIDADIMFYLGYDTYAQYEQFLTHPAAQALPAYQNDAIYYYDAESFGYGLAGMRAAVAWIVECITGEPFE